MTGSSNGGGFKHLGSVVRESYTELRARHDTWARGFSCANLTGGSGAPCTGDPLRVASPWTPGERIRCPIAESVNCDPWQRRERERQAREAAEARLAWVETGKRRGIPRLFIDAELQTAEQTPAIAQVAAFLPDGAQQGKALILLGAWGTGKTFATAAAVRACRGEHGSSRSTDSRGSSMIPTRAPRPSRPPIPRSYSAWMISGVGSSAATGSPRA